MAAPAGIVLVRHADAVARAHWTEEDAARPLTGKGERQATALADALAYPPPARLLTSPSRRCCDTLRPLAERTGLALETEPRLAEGSEPAAALARLLEAVAAGGGPVVACSHGDVVDGLVRRLVAEGADLRGLGGIRAVLETPKGGRWLLEVTGSTVAAGALLGPPAAPKEVPK